MSEPKREKKSLSFNVHRIIAALLLAVIIAVVAIFFAVRRSAHIGGGVRGQKESNKIYSSQWVRKNVPSAMEPLSSQDSAALKAYEAAYAEDSMKRAIARTSERAAESAKAALKANEAAYAEDSMKRAIARTSERAAESVKAAKQLQIDCLKDTLMPVVYPDSTGGMHIGPEHVFLQTNKPCTVYWRFDPDTSWYVWNADTFVIDCTVTLAYKAVDHCGRTTEPRVERYEIRPFGFVEGTPELPSVNCANDTLMPWVYPDPAGGLHYGPTHVCFQANKPCTVYWRFGRDTSWRVWHSDTLLIDSTTSLAYKAVDRCGHAMGPEEVYYEIRPVRKTFPCPAGMEPVEDGSKQFCIDRYEWPDRKGAIPQFYVTIYQAMDSCAAAGKRLCTSDEWSLACAGPDSFPYPYGLIYSRHACVTHDTTVRRSGSKPECRAFFGAYDMSGNLAEWTSTPAKRNPSFYNVMGGFWESGPASGCFSARYSYYPQNRHNPVGFRCCKDFASTGK